MIHLRQFEKVSYEKENEQVVLPYRKTELAAGYDFTAPYSFSIPSMGIVSVLTGVKCYMNDNEYLQLAVRSGLASQGVILAQGVGIIDADYVDNEKNEGNIGFTLINLSRKPIHIMAGDRVGHGIFVQYALTDNDADTPKEKRKGGWGSTGK